MKGEVFKGNVRDVCAELKAEAQRCKGAKVAEWLKQRRRDKVEQAEARQFGISVSELRRIATNK